MNTKYQLKKDAIERIVSTARMMIDGKIHLVDGARIICRLRMHIDIPSPDDEIYNVFVIVKYETHDLPVNPNKDSKYKSLLMHASHKIEEYTNLMSPYILTACKNIIDKLTDDEYSMSSS